LIGGGVIAGAGVVWWVVAAQGHGSAQRERTYVVPLPIGGAVGAVAGGVF
jgi:hypothetical protein